ncbi:MAG: hypothetical protein Q8L08_03550 [Candidatus Nanopelagicaceae bacterium]|nr:hypothetical protein [Candidatus Nanopelagicaceae bacterium]
MLKGLLVGTYNERIASTRYCGVEHLLLLIFNFPTLGQAPNAVIGMSVASATFSIAQEVSHKPSG